MTKDIQTIYEKIRNDIITLKIKPGSRLKEEEVSKQFKISRTPIRDVFKRLEQDNLLVIYPQSGTFVTKIRLDSINDILFFRSAVEYLVLTDLISVINPGDIIRLKTLLDNQRDLLKDDGKDNDEKFASFFFSLDNEFHSIIFDKAGKQSILTLLNDSYPYFARYRYLTFLRDEKEITSLLEIHYRIVEVLENKDLANLKGVVLAHNYAGLTGIEKVRDRHPDYFES